MSKYKEINDLLSRASANVEMPITFNLAEFELEDHYQDVWIYKNKQYAANRVIVNPIETAPGWYEYYFASELVNDDGEIVYPMWFIGVTLGHIDHLKIIHFDLTNLPTV